jgi:hypothetical protein
MKPPTVAAAIACALLMAGAAAFAQSSTRAPATDCTAIDYNCNAQPKGIGSAPATDPNDRNAARLRSELRTPAPASSTEPEEPEQPIHSSDEPEEPIH